MTPKNQSVAIATAVGWKNHDHPDCMVLKIGWSMPEKWCMDPAGKLRFNHQRPDYPNDLSAIVGAVRALPKEQQQRFMHRLRDVTNPAAVYLSESFDTVTAAPAQWCEAYLKTLNLWTE